MRRQNITQSDGATQIKYSEPLQSFNVNTGEQEVKTRQLIHACWVWSYNSTFLASRCVYSRQWVSGWMRKLLQHSLSPLWSLLSWRVWDRRATQTWVTEWLLGSFLSTFRQKTKRFSDFIFKWHFKLNSSYLLVLEANRSASFSRERAYSLSISPRRRR